MYTSHTIARVSAIATMLIFMTACSSSPKKISLLLDPVTTCQGAPDARDAPKALPLVVKDSFPIPTVYFDFDQYIVQPLFVATLNDSSQFLQANKGRKILIQGNTDDQGGREYNLALGQKRADAVRKVLILSGVLESQIEAVSLGKEKPKAIGSSKQARATNRRADIIDLVR